MTIYFYDELLESVSITSVDDNSSESRSDWSEENELKRKEIHDQWLKNLLVNTSSHYAWGGVWSGYDPKAGFSSIEIRYLWPGKPLRG